MVEFELALFELVVAVCYLRFFFFFFSSRRRHTRWNCDWSSDVCSSDLGRWRATASPRLTTADRPPPNLVRRPTMSSSTTLAASRPGTADDDLRSRLFRTMAYSRAVEDLMKVHLKHNRFDGWWHPGEGQEAAAAGAAAALASDDYLFYQGRGVTWPIGKGMDLDRILGDLLGRTTGATRGKGGGVPHW